jgi:hypothetical protein
VARKHAYAFPEKDEVCSAVYGAFGLPGMGKQNLVFLKGL